MKVNPDSARSNHINNRNENRKKRTQTKIRSAATEVFFEKGYIKASILDIMEKADLGCGTFYKYYKNKKEIFSELFNEAIKDIQDTPVKMPTSTNSMNIVFLDATERLMKKFSENRKIIKVVKDFYQTDDELKDMWESLINERINSLRKSLYWSKNRGLCRNIDIEYTTILIWGMFSAGINYTLDNELSDEDIKNLSKSIATLYKEAVFVVDEVPHGV